MSTCIFCKILKNEIPAQKLAETEELFAVSDINPQAPMHILIIPKIHVASLNDLSLEDRKNLLPQIYTLADKLMGEKGLRERGYRTVINNQKDGGQTVFHLHMHVLAGAALSGRFA
jgi:histidine triad (HIT) family protein